MEYENLYEFRKFKKYNFIKLFQAHFYIVEERECIYLLNCYVEEIYKYATDCEI